MEKVVCKNSATGRTMVFEYGDTVFLEGVDDIGAASFTISTSKMASLSKAKARTPGTLLSAPMSSLTMTLSAISWMPFFRRA